MVERVSRRSAFKKLLSGSIDAFMRILTDDAETTVSQSNSKTAVSSEQAGHLLRSRKTPKSTSKLHLHSDLKNTV